MGGAPPVLPQPELEESAPAAFTRNAAGKARPERVGDAAVPGNQESDRVSQRAELRDESPSAGHDAPGKEGRQAEKGS